MDIKYFDLHVNFDADGGYSIPVDMPQSEIKGNDLQANVTNYALERGLFVEDGDEHFVDYVSEIDFEDFLDMKGC